MKYSVTLGVICDYSSFCMYSCSVIKTYVMRYWQTIEPNSDLRILIQYYLLLLVTIFFVRYIGFFDCLSTSHLEEEHQEHQGHII